MTDTARCLTTTDADGGDARHAVGVHIVQTHSDGKAQAAWTQAVKLRPKFFAHWAWDNKIPAVW